MIIRIPNSIKRALCQHDFRQKETHQGPVTDENNFICGSYVRAIHKCLKCDKHEVHTVFYGEDAHKWKIKTFRQIVAERELEHKKRYLHA